MSAFRLIVTFSELLETIQFYSKRYTRYQTIVAIAKSFVDKGLGKLALKIDLSKNYGHIVRLAVQNHMTSETLSKKIQTVQQQYQQEVWGNLCKETPLLAEYEKVVQRVAKTQGYQNEQLQKTLRTIALRITNDSLLLNQLQRDLPIVAVKLWLQARVQINRMHTH